MSELRYNIHGHGLTLQISHPDVEPIAQELLGSFLGQAGPGASCSVIDIKQVDTVDRLPGVPERAEALFSQDNRARNEDDPIEGWTVYADGDRFLVDFHNQGRLFLNTAEDTVETWLVRPETEQRDIRVNLLHFGMVELLKRHGLFTIHACALERNRQGVLIPAFSGQGKSTTCISLMRSGFGCLADDHPFVRQGPNGPELLSFPEKVDVTDQTVAFFPELSAADAPLDRGLYKWSFRADEVYPHSPVESARPSVILFPKIIDWPKSYLEEMPRSRALEEMMPHGFRVLDKDIARTHFETLAALVRASRCYRLFFGEDVLDLPRLVEPLLEGDDAATPVAAA